MALAKISSLYMYKQKLWFRDGFCCARRITGAHFSIQLLHKTFSKSPTQIAPAVTITGVKRQNMVPAT